MYTVWIGLQCERSGALMWKAEKVRCVFVLFFTSAQLSETRWEQPRSFQQSQVRHVSVSMGACAALWLSGGLPVTTVHLWRWDLRSIPGPREKRGDILREIKEDEEEYMATCWSSRSHTNETRAKTQRVCECVWREQVALNLWKQGRARSTLPEPVSVGVCVCVCVCVCVRMCVFV